MLALLLLLSSYPSIPTGSIGKASAQPVHRTYWLIGSSNWNWNYSDSQPGPVLIELYDADTLTLMLRKSEFDGITHNWFLDFNNNNLVDSNEQATSSPDFSSTTQYMNFTFMATVGGNIPGYGTWIYKCKYHPTQMYDSLAVYSPYPDFAVFTSNPSLKLSPGSANGTTVVIASRNAYAGSLSLSASAPSGTGLTATLGRTDLNVDAGGTNTTTLNVSAESTTELGTYNITLTASNSTVTRTFQLTVSVANPASPPSNPQQLPTTVLAGILGIGIILLLAVIFAFARRRKKPSVAQQ